MTTVGITGSIASGKTTVSKLISNSRGPLFSADKIVKRLYKKKNLKEIIAKKLNFRSISNFKNELKKAILKNKKNLEKLEKIIHPLVRKEMLVFLKKNKNKKIIFFEIPLLIESKLKHHFDVILFIKSKKKIAISKI